MTFFQFITLFISVGLISMSATGIILKYLHKKEILDHPNQRSSHSTPTPRGGGIGILIAIIPAIALVNFTSDAPLVGTIPVLCFALLLAGLSWVDDLRTLGPGIRFFCQILSVMMTLYFLPSPTDGYLGGVAPLWLEKVILAFGWIWFINLFNFMDGIDGITGVEVISISSGVVLISLFSSLSTEYTQTGLILAAAALGFLKWNWHKAKVFMGDVGSVPLGFILGWVLILLIAEGFLIASMLVALYYLCDASLTLFKRALRKEKIWLPHREHYYQLATQAGLSHGQTVIRIAFVNMGLLFCAWMSLSGFSLIALCFGFCLVACLLYHFATYKKEIQE